VQLFEDHVLLSSFVYSAINMFSKRRVRTGSDN